MSGEIGKISNIIFDLRKEFHPSLCFKIIFIFILQLKQKELVSNAYRQLPKSGSERVIPPESKGMRK